MMMSLSGGDGWDQHYYDGMEWIQDALVLNIEQHGQRRRGGKTGNADCATLKNRDDSISEYIVPISQYKLPVSSLLCFILTIS